MNFDVHTTAYGRPAVELLAAQVRAAKGGDPLAPVTVIVPSNYAAVSTGGPSPPSLEALPTSRS